MHEWESDSFEGLYHGGHLVLTDKATGACGIVKLLDSRGQDVTLAQFRAGVKSHGVARALSVFAKLVTNWQGKK